MIAGFLDIEEEDKPDSKSDDSSAEDEDEKEIPVAKSKSKAKKDDLDDDEDEDDADSDDDDSDDDADDNSSGLDIEEVRTRVNEVRELFATAKQALEEYGRGSAQADEAYAQLADRFMLLKLNNRMADQVMAIMHDTYDDVRKQERQIMRLVIRRGKMPRAEFRKDLPKQRNQCRLAG